MTHKSAYRRATLLLDSWGLRVVVVREELAALFVKIYEEGRRDADAEKASLEADFLSMTERCQKAEMKLRGCGIGDLVFPQNKP